jgi:UDP-N-acetyl-2-amino-2-deoxyglucuronate dehydrogenase
LSINSDNLPSHEVINGKRTFRKIKVDGDSFEFSDGFTDLHTKSYSEIFNGKGFTIFDSEASIKIAHQIRTLEPVGLVGDYHPLAKLPVTKHPFKK